jgi:pilus assembly protein Flp/PilA
VASATRYRKENMKALLRKLGREIRGQDLVEYALAAGLMAVGAVAAMPTLTDTFARVADRIAAIVDAQVK